MRALAAQAVACWQGRPGTGDWTIELLAAGGNSVVLRADRGADPLAVKLSPIDGRERGEREYAALSALAGSGLAPDPAALVARPAGAEVTALITSWVQGAPSEPSWPVSQRLAQALALAHYQSTVEGLRPAFPAPDPVALLQRGRVRTAELPADVADPLRTAIDELSGDAPPAVHCGLIHADPNPANLMGATLVDWEDSGFGDPVLDLAYLCAHPRLLDVCGRDPVRCKQLGERFDDRDLLDRAPFALSAVVLYWTIMHEILLRTPPPRLAGAHQRDPAQLRKQLLAYRDWLRRLTGQRLADR